MDRQFSRAKFLKSAGLTTLGAVFPLLWRAHGGEAVQDPISATVERLFQSSIVIDGVVSPWVNEDRFPGSPGEIDQLTAIDIGAFTVPVEQLRETFSWKREFQQERNNAFVLIERASDIDLAWRTNRYGPILYVQKDIHLGGSVAPLLEWKRDGLRILQITYSNENELGGGDRPESTDLPLSPLGRDVVKELNRLNMVVDVSHTGRRTTLDVVETTSQPITANHTSAAALTDHFRAKSDQELRAIAGTGGVIGVVTVGRFIERPGRPRSIDDFVAHVDYMVELVGIDHVGVATDGWLSGAPAYETDRVDPLLNGMDRWKHVAQRLFDMGYSATDLQKLLGLNFKRVYQYVLDP